MSLNNCGDDWSLSIRVNDITKQGLFCAVRKKDLTFLSKLKNVFHSTWCESQGKKLS